PTTAGHSERVARLTVGLARALEKGAPAGSEYAGLHFRPTEIRQIRYAALLHDFGKVGVREHVLVKANKLYPHELESLRSRFDLIRATVEIERLRARIDGRDDEALGARAEELDAFWEFIQTCNRPTVLSEGSFERLHEIAQRKFSFTLPPLDGNDAR